MIERPSSGRPAAGHPTALQREVRELELLLEIGQLLDQSLELHDVIGPAVEAIGRRMGMTTAACALLNRETGEIRTEAASGMTVEERKRCVYRVGEGVTGLVVQSGEPRAVRKVSGDPYFLNRSGTLEPGGPELSFVCVPVKSGNEVIGALSGVRPFSPEDDLDDDVRLLSIAGSMVAQAVRLRRGAQEERDRLLAENALLRESLGPRFRPPNIIGTSKEMQVVYDLVGQVSKSVATVLVRGESGVGKEMVAHAIHYASLRAAKPFVRVNCAALPPTVLESELFGHEKGAFTGATAQRKGRFELAHGGTIFLDEVGDFSPATQITLLRVLQEREFERVGGSETVKVDVRVIAATNKNLEALIAAGHFREDLYYRLDVFPIHVPPLRERRGDIMLLADHFVEVYSRHNGKKVKRISTPAIDMLMAYHWPGNVRELENCIERAVLLTRDEVIHGHHLPPSLQTAEASDTLPTGSLQSALDRLERELIVEALKANRGNQAKAAKDLGVSERIMGLRVKKHGLDPRRFATGT
jgi:Nif-specific regulatory protein